MVQIAGGLCGTICSHLMFSSKIDTLIEVSQVTRDGGSYFSELIGTFILVFTIYSCTRNNSGRTSLTIGLLVGGMLLTTSSTMFANPQVTLARIFTYSIAGISASSAVLFIVAQLIGAILAAGVIKLGLSRVTKVSEPI